VEEKSGVTVCRESYRLTVIQKRREDAKGRSIHKVVHLEMKEAFAGTENNSTELGYPR